ncbi:MAG TPA: ribonuclease HII [Pyrinomonadaceae bacterium]|nr:ribonuclease HII [Pyrinomonadaceae bacterium]
MRDESETGLSEGAESGGEKAFKHSSISSGRPSSFIPHPSSLRKRRRQSAVCTVFEDEARSRGFHLIAGVDEVGRGALAGPVVAAAVILDPEKPFPEGLDDSKRLTALQREALARELLQTAVCYAVGQIEADEIDRVNILEATRRAMMEALCQLNPSADFLLIDAVQLKESSLPQKAIIGGDSISASIAAASIIAKTYRDSLMHAFHEIYPQYGFARHVGYGTRAHWEALSQHGPCLLHRKSFRGVLANKENFSNEEPLE